MKLVKYYGFVLEDGPFGYKCEVKGTTKHFVTASSWKRFVDTIKGVKK